MHPPYATSTVRTMSVPPPGGSGGSITSPRPGSSSSQSPGPHYDSFYRPGTGGQYGRRVSTASSITSIGGALDTAHDASSPIPEFGNNGEATA